MKGWVHPKQGVEQGSRGSVGDMSPSLVLSLPEGDMSPFLVLSLPASVAEQAWAPGSILICYQVVF